MPNSPVLKTFVVMACIAGIATTAPGYAKSIPAALQAPISHHYIRVGDVNVFYREAGDPARPAILLLHGFPTSSLMYRKLIPQLSDRYHVIAPDLPGFGFTQSPDRTRYAYTFDHLAETIDKFTEALALRTYAMEVFDYGAPVGWRLALSHPDRITAIVTQNGNAYEEGLSDGWKPIQQYWNDHSAANRNALRAFLTPAAVKAQYTQGAKDPESVDPETYTLDAAMVGRPDNAEIQLDLFLDYASNVALYPKVQAYFRAFHPPTLAVWGKNDPFFLPKGAEAFKRDNPASEVRFYDAGHFALETDGPEMGAEIRRFLDTHIKP